MEGQQESHPFTPPQGQGALPDTAALRPAAAHRLAHAHAQGMRSSFSPGIAASARNGNGTLGGAGSAFMLAGPAGGGAGGGGGVGESSFSIIRDDPEASRSGLIGMSPLWFRQGPLVPHGGGGGVGSAAIPLDGAMEHGSGAAGGAGLDGAAMDLGSPGPSRAARLPGSLLGLTHEPILPTTKPASASRVHAADVLEETSTAIRPGDDELKQPAHVDQTAAMLQRMRIWRTDAMHHHLYDSAIFWGDKILSLEETALAWNDAYWLAQAYFITHQYARAEHLLTMPLRSAYTRKLAEEQQYTAASVNGSRQEGANAQVPSEARRHPSADDLAQIPRAVDVLGAAISRARESSVLPKALLDKAPVRERLRGVPHHDETLFAFARPDKTLNGLRGGMDKTASTSTMTAGKRKDRTFTVSGTGTGSSVGDHDGENGSIESGNSGGTPVEDADFPAAQPLSAGDASSKEADVVTAAAREWEREDIDNLRDIADRKLAAFDGPVLANNSLACRCLAAQCQVRLGKYYEALDTLGGDAAPWNLKGQQSKQEPAVDGGIKLGSTAHYLRGQIYMRLDDLVKARECFMHALAIDVKNYEAFCALVNGNLLSVAEQWSFVNELHYAAQAGDYPEDGDFIRLTYVSRLPKQAAEQLAQASAARRALMVRFKVQDNADVLWSLAEELFAQMRYADAYTITSRIMELSKDHEGALPIHVTCMFYMPKLRPALFMLAHRLVDDDPESPAAWYAVGAWYASAGRWAEARRYFSKATLLDPRFAPSWIAFGHSFANEGESDQAITAYATAARKFPFSQLPKLFIGMEHCHQGNFKLAAIFLKGALKTAPKDPLTLNEMGVLHYLNGEVEEAIEHFEQALTASGQVQEPTTAWTVVHMNLAFALRSAGRDDEAHSRFLRVIELEPINVAAHVGVGMCEHKRGNLSSAIAWYHDALALNPRDIFCTALLDMALEESLASVRP